MKYIYIFVYIYRPTISISRAKCMIYMCMCMWYASVWLCVCVTGRRKRAAKYVGGGKGSSLSIGWYFQERDGGFCACAKYFSSHYF